MKQSLLQGNSSSYNDIKFYKSLGSLIKDYREWRVVSQESFAELLGVSDRQIRNWEADRGQICIENLHNLAEITGIPAQVCLALNFGQPIWYSQRYKRFAFSILDKKLFSFPQELLKKYELFDNVDLYSIKSIVNDKHISKVLVTLRDIYGYGSGSSPLQNDVIKAACRFLPELNRIIFDQWGHYSGHQICLPINKGVYGEITKRGAHGGYLSSKKISDILAQRQGVLFIYSLFTSSPIVGYINCATLWQSLIKIAQKKNYLVAFSPLTEGGHAFVRKLGFRHVMNHDRMHNEIYPEIYEIELVALIRSWISEASKRVVERSHYAAEKTS